MKSTPLLEVQDLKKWYATDGRFFSRGRQYVKAVDGVTFEVFDGEVLGLVGESGSGKSTIGQTVLRLTSASSGAIRFDGQDITSLPRRALRAVRERMQLIFQDPYASLNPRKSVQETLLAPLKIHRLKLTREERDARVAEALRVVGLRPEHAHRYPHEFSGGQRQRVVIARALMTRPKLLVADEPVSALDVSIQAQVINLLASLKQKLGLSILFISHDLAVVGHLSDRVAVMYLGRLVEIAPTAALFGQPRHPYTEALLSAIPEVDGATRRERIVLTGEVPSPRNPPSGCAFRTRCRYALPACAIETPQLRVVSPLHFKACIRDDLELQPATEQISTAKRTFAQEGEV
ncbi:peptide ABC transporter ATP-binding protein [Burkholderia sp. SG-MS1]|uniref:ABC transporter ATP-binding protein n=1 Tax=Paraburkholderia sp. SG-MS1 TaxID=2023741 RepID=UPI001447FFC9|nr:oligopeptide/dipeptide ABC transporter ATP-binding protein [Paraburkholderia sp. SG-MS1]NKJ45623.1 peptide ABC transporter ATP-binding protein [Paraburkholderia sp. SG-MS1]